MSVDPLRNPKDPLRDAGPPNDAELFRRFSEMSAGFPVDVVLRAAMNVVLNALRQAHSRRASAEKSFDELVGRSKHVLLEMHYDGMGNRRNIFPYDQKIELGDFFNKQKF